MQNQYFSTQNAALAMALDLLGVKGSHIENVYDEDGLGRIYRKLKSEGREVARKGHVTAKEAFANGEPGILTYFFEHSDDLSKLLKAWDDTRKMADEEQPINLARVSLTDAMTIAAAYAEKRAAFRKIWKRYEPKVFIPKSGEPVIAQHGDHTIVQYPGFKLLSLNASAETREHLGV